MKNKKQRLETIARAQIESAMEKSSYGNWIENYEELSNVDLLMLEEIINDQEEVSDVQINLEKKEVDIALWLEYVKNYVPGDEWGGENE